MNVILASGFIWIKYLYIFFLKGIMDDNNVVLVDDDYNIVLVEFISINTIHHKYMLMKFIII